MSDWNEIYEELNNTEDTTAEFDPRDIAQNRAMAILAYISWLVLIPLFAARGSKYARYHCNQGLVLAIAELILNGAVGALSRIPLLGLPFRIANLVLAVIFTIYTVLGIVNAARGRAKELPLIGRIRILR